MKYKRPWVNPHAVWEPFQECHYVVGPDGQEVELTPDLGFRIVKNNIYTVNIEEVDAPYPWNATWLSIKRNDKEPLVQHWRELQLIKNAVCGSEREAIEIYPAESRMVDTSNQYHLWVFPEGFRIPLGYADRLVIDHTVSDSVAARGSRQRPWPKHLRPPDTMTGKEYDDKNTLNPKRNVQRMVHRRRMP